MISDPSYKAKNKMDLNVNKDEILFYAESYKLNELSLIWELYAWKRESSCAKLCMDIILKCKEICPL